MNNVIIKVIVGILSIVGVVLLLISFFVNWSFDIRLIGSGLIAVANLIILIKYFIDTRRNRK